MWPEKFTVTGGYMNPKLFAVCLGGKPAGCTIEQHNVFFGVADRLEDLFERIKAFWPAAPKIHIDAYMCVEEIGNYNIIPFKRGELSLADTEDEDGQQKLFFVNLGGYRRGFFGEVHKSILLVAEDQTEAIALAKTDPFFHQGVCEGKAVPHIDDKHTLEEFEDDCPLNVGQVVRPQGYDIRLSRVRTLTSPNEIYPEVVITGFLKVP